MKSCKHLFYKHRDLFGEQGLRSRVLCCEVKVSRKLWIDQKSPPTHTHTLNKSFDLFSSFLKQIILFYLLLTVFSGKEKKKVARLLKRLKQEQWAGNRDGSLKVL